MCCRKRIDLFWILFAAALFLQGLAGAEQANKIQKIDIDVLDQMVKGSDRTLLVFMAAWCKPCIKELPDVNTLYEKYRDRGLKIVGISVDFDGPAAMQPIVDNLKVNFPVYWLGEEAIDVYNIRGIPYIIFVRNGEIVERLLGHRSKEYLDKKFKAFLVQP